ncbi:hypothetical protein H1C71_037701 [Ictidomys tridecemlineatus]|nr:hypothetical protein H1C71_037701 [Ictidomys tridecemlineatus]
MWGAGAHLAPTLYQKLLRVQLLSGKAGAGASGGGRDQGSMCFPHLLPHHIHVACSHTGLWTHLFDHVYRGPWCGCAQACRPLAWTSLAFLLAMEGGSCAFAQCLCCFLATPWLTLLG